jgi:hypothetical protein
MAKRNLNDEDDEVNDEYDECEGWQVYNYGYALPMDFPITWKSPLTEEDRRGEIFSEYLERWAGQIKENLQEAHSKAAKMWWTNW